jgi:hypothetical protein
MTSWLKVVAIVGLTMSLSSCDFYFSKLQFVNGSDSQVIGLTVSDSRKTWRLGDLARGQRVTFSGHLSGEGGPTITWTWRGHSFTEQGCYYTDGSPAKGTLTIAGAKLLPRCG